MRARRHRPCPDRPQRPASGAWTRPAPATTATGRRAAVRAACERVADHLGNTAAIARRSYIDPRVTAAFAFERGDTIRARLVGTELTGEHLQERIEPAVIHLLTVRR